jgi:hypothetical protein
MNENNWTKYNIDKLKLSLECINNNLEYVNKTMNKGNKTTVMKIKRFSAVKKSDPNSIIKFVDGLNDNLCRIHSNIVDFDRMKRVKIKRRVR